MCIHADIVEDMPTNGSKKQCVVEDIRMTCEVPSMSVDTGDVANERLVAKVCECCNVSANMAHGCAEETVSYRRKRLHP